jgi:hypothetical protein
MEEKARFTKSERITLAIIFSIAMGVFCMFAYGLIALLLTTFNAIIK